MRFGPSRVQDAEADGTKVPSPSTAVDDLTLNRISKRLKALRMIEQSEPYKILSRTGEHMKAPTHRQHGLLRKRDWVKKLCT